MAQHQQVEHQQVERPMGDAGDKLLPWRQRRQLRHRMQQPPHQADDDEEQDRGANREVPGHPALIQSFAADMGMIEPMAYCTTKSAKISQCRLLATTP